MNILEFEETNDTPYVKVDPESGVIELLGKSFPEDPVGFYETIFEWIKANFTQSTENIEVKIKLEYYNTSTSRYLLKLFEILADIKKDYNSKLVINWFFTRNDEDMKEAGAAYEGISELPFRLIEEG